MPLVRSLGRDNGLIAVSLFLWGLGSGLYQFIWPLYIKSLGASSVEIGLVLSLGGVVAILAYIPGGLAADRYSRKKNMILAWILGALAAPIYALAQDWRQLLIGSVFMNASQFCNPALSSYIAQAGTERDLGRTFTVVFAGFSLGMAVSPPLGGLMMEAGQMRSLFGVSFLLYVLSTVAVCLIKDRPLAAVQTTAKRGYRHVLMDRRVMVLVLVFFAMYVAGIFGRSFAPVYLEEHRGLSQSLIGSLGTVLSIGSFVLALLMGFLSVRVGIIGALLVAESLLMLGHSVFLQFVGLFPAAMAYFLWGIGNPVNSLTQALLSRELAPESIGKGYALQNMVQSLAMVAAPYGTGLLYSIQPRLPFLTVALAAPLLMVTTVAVGRRQGRREAAVRLQ